MRGESKRTQSLALLALLAGAAGIATSGIFVRLSETGPTATAFWRGALALPPLAIWAWLESRSGLARSRVAAPASPGNAAQPQLRRATFWAGVFFAGDLLLWHWSLLKTSIAASTLEANLAPVIVTLIGWLLWRERPRALFLLALGLALVGLMLMVAPKLGHSGRTLIGDALGVGTAFFYAAYLVVIARLRSGYRTGTVMFRTTLVFTVLLLPIALTQKFLPHTWHGWALVGGLALAAQFVGQSLIAYALAHLPTNFSALSLYVQPLLAALYARAFLGETLAPIQILGGVVILAALALARRAARPAV